jgi:hypothetical protein
MRCCRAVVPQTLANAMHQRVVFAAEHRGEQQR